MRLDSKETADHAFVSQLLVYRYWGERKLHIGIAIELFQQKIQVKE